MFDSNPVASNKATLTVSKTTSNSEEGDYVTLNLNVQGGTSTRLKLTREQFADVLLGTTVRPTVVFVKESRRK